ncbi:MAG: hypothetical protein QN699_09340 [Nitrososphaeraceae archaeon]|nr:hypothetical protein [Nitrososphaeraceae archaeon]
MYISSTDALRQLMLSENTGAYIVKISPKDNTLTNGVDYCYVGLKCHDGTDYSVQAYGKEARELHEEATIMAIRSIMLVSPTNPEKLPRLNLPCLPRIE